MNIDPKNNQQVFDFVYKAIFEQGVPASNGFNCLYRQDGSDNKCAVGHLIPDAEYLPAFEGAELRYNSFDNPLAELMQSKGYDLELLHEMQQAHDMIDILDEVWRMQALWNKNMIKVAETFGLVPPERFTVGS